MYTEIAMVKQIFLQFFYVIFLVSRTTEGDTDKPVAHEPEEFLKMFDFWKPICSIPQNNVVKQRGDSININVRVDQFPWSLDHPSIHTFTGKNSTKLLCANLDDIRKTLNYPVLEHDCTVPWLSALSIATVLNKYSAVIFLGDSLTRQMTMALRMLLSGDLRFGGYPIQSLSSDVHRYCACDGQFSEDILCRQTTQTEDFDFLPGACNSEFCKRLPILNNVTFGFTYKDMLDFKTYKLCSDDTSGTRPILVFIQGGTHYRTNPNFFIHTRIVPAIAEIQAYLQACPKKVDINRLRFIFSGVPVVDSRVEHKYPAQERSNAAKFNREIEIYTNNNIKNSVFLNFWNLTLEATDRTCDGFHSLTDINLMKTMVLLNSMNFLVAP
jgi:hypothetical protein